MVPNPRINQNGAISEVWLHREAEFGKPGSSFCILSAPTVSYSLIFEVWWDQLVWVTDLRHKKENIQEVLIWPTFHGWVQKHSANKQGQI